MKELLNMFEICFMIHEVSRRSYRKLAIKPLITTAVTRDAKRKILDGSGPDSGFEKISPTFGLRHRLRYKWFCSRPRFLLSGEPCTDASLTLDPGKFSGSRSGSEENLPPAPAPQS